MAYGLCATPQEMVVAGKRRGKELVVVGVREIWNLPGNSDLEREVCCRKGRRLDGVGGGGRHTSLALSGALSTVKKALPGVWSGN